MIWGTIGALLQKLDKKVKLLVLPLKATPLVRHDEHFRYDMGTIGALLQKLDKKVIFSFLPLKARSSKARATLSNDMGTIGALLQKLEKKVLYSTFL